MSEAESPSQTDERKFQHNEQELDWLRSALRDRIDYVEDPALKRRLYDWMRRSLKIPGGDVQDYLEGELSRMESEYRMYDHAEAEDVEDAFPEECSDCPHYGGGCPITTRSTPQADLTRTATEASSLGQYKREVRKIARLYECHRIPEWITEFENRYEGVIEEGWELFEETDIDLGEMDSPQPEPKVDLTADDEDESTRGGN